MVEVSAWFAAHPNSERSDFRIRLIFGLFFARKCVLSSVQGAVRFCMSVQFEMEGLEVFTG